MPSATWTTWPSGRIVDVFVGQVVEASGVLPWNGAESRMAGINWRYGAGISQ